MAARKKTATTKTNSKKPATKVAKNVAKKPATKIAKNVAKKPATKVAKSSAPAAKAASLKIASIAPSRDGSQWTLTLSDGGKAKISAAAAQCVGVRTGGPWSVKLAEEVEQAAFEQLLFARAMELLAKKGRTTNDALVKLLGGDAAARRAVAELKKHGWVS